MKFSLRPLSQSDAPSLAKYANNWEIAKNLTDKFPHPYNEENALDFINFATTTKVSHIFAIDVEGEFTGGIGLHLQDDIHKKNAELGYWLGEPFWNNGILSQAIPQIVKYGFENLEITRIFARPFGSNIASQRVLEKSGFVLEAKFDKTIWKKDRFEDEFVYGIRKTT